MCVALYPFVLSLYFTSIIFTLSDNSFHILLIWGLSLKYVVLIPSPLSLDTKLLPRISTQDCVYALYSSESLYFSELLFFTVSSFLSEFPYFSVSFFSSLLLFFKLLSIFWLLVLIFASKSFTIICIPYISLHLKNSFGSINLSISEVYLSSKNIPLPSCAESSILSILA